MRNQNRVIIEHLTPVIDGGIFQLKRVQGQSVHVEADIFSDGHDHLSAELIFTHNSSQQKEVVSMESLPNDRWQADFKVTELGNYHFHLEAWVDEPLTWLYGTQKKLEAQQEVYSELLEGALYIEQCLAAHKVKKKAAWEKIAAELQDRATQGAASKTLFDPSMEAFFKTYPLKKLVTKSLVQGILVERKKALFSTWYEFFPRSSASESGVHGTFEDCKKLLPRVANMGFDTLYFPPIHPIGEINRKGKNNATEAQSDDVGSPWGIGSKLGGHRSLHPALGNLEQFTALVQEAQHYGIEIAMDLAFQMAPDHPLVKEHPEWFKWRPDGSIQYAENPPKKYQDILPIYFDTEAWNPLWDALLEITLYWIETAGIKVYRVDNPHTKPFHFWGWLMAEVRAKHPEVLFLSEAFSRPAIMYQLAKQGFTQSYSYFTWRNRKEELQGYVEELSKTQLKEFFRPNFWPNTPDINPFHLQGANEALHMSRYFLAATLSSNTGIYGPIYEFMTSDAIPGKEEYLDSEKYQIRDWDWEAENKLMRIIGKINEARKQLPSLQQTNNIRFCQNANENILAYLKYDDAQTCLSLMAVNLDPYYTQNDQLYIPLEALGLPTDVEYTVEDQITGNSYHWRGTHNFVELHPALPFHLFKIKI
ncbi:MAG: alpha-1,4-glucan--maltose-1-phosphate maltosyltransferase [Flavobacteriaceae bacterium]|jgi:starch synthase (maltosyl-transferring)|nr:alpha-1,4-glucan--maltose-1-phosphate maltosyltransferase [Flavobacteriaceae bacterium]